jgi:prepilin-type N-terminal cleavage/methylation domain-containing protein
MMNPFKTTVQRNAFTLVELLTVLVAIGVIAAILVPKVMVAGQQAAQRTQLQVMIETIDGHFYDEHLNGNQFLTENERWATLQNKLQTSQTCNFGMGNLAPCLPPGVPDNATVGGGAVRLNNGMTLYGLLSTPTSTNDDFYVDVNGNEGPNLGGLGGANIADDCNDRFHFNLNNVTGEITPIECTVEVLND